MRKNKKRSYKATSEKYLYEKLAFLVKDVLVPYTWILALVANNLKQWLSLFFCRENQEERSLKLNTSH